MLNKTYRKNLKRLYKSKDRNQNLNKTEVAFEILSESENKERAAFAKEALRIFIAKKKERKVRGAK